MLGVVPQTRKDADTDSTLQGCFTKGVINHGPEPERTAAVCYINCEQRRPSPTAMCSAFFYFALAILNNRSGIFERYNVSGKSESVNERTNTD